MIIHNRNVHHVYTISVTNPNMDATNVLLFDSETIHLLPPPMILEGHRPIDVRGPRSIESPNPGYLPPPIIPEECSPISENNLPATKSANAGNICKRKMKTWNKTATISSK